MASTKRKEEGRGLSASFLWCILDEPSWCLGLDNIPNVDGQRDGGKEGGRVEEKRSEDGSTPRKQATTVKEWQCMSIRA